MNRVFVTFLVCELAYIVSVRLLIRNHTGSALDREIWWTLARLISAIVLLRLMSRLPRPPTGQPRAINQCLLATGMFFAPVLVGNMGLGAGDRYFFAATSVIVALREEVAYRGILQSFLTARGLPLWASLCASNLAFVAYHWGIQTFTLHYVLQIFLTGTILGLVYHFSGRLLLVVALHAIYDALDSFTPFLAQPLPDPVCTVVLVLTLAVLLLGRQIPQRLTERSP